MRRYYHGSTFRFRHPDELDELLDEQDALADEHDQIVDEEHRIASQSFDEDDGL